MKNEMGIPPEELQSLIVEFLTEGHEHLEVLNAKLLEAETVIKNGDSMSDDDLNAMFRAAHTIKGTASFIGLTKTVELTHEMETILQRVKNREMTLTLAIVDVLFKAFDVLSILFGALMEKGDEEGDVSECVQIIKDILEGKETQEEAKEQPITQDYEINEKYLGAFIVEAEQNIDDLDIALLKFEKSQEDELVNELFRFMHTIKGAAGLINEKRIHAVSHRMENIFSYIRENNLVPEENVFAILFKGIDTIRVMVDSLKKGVIFQGDIDELCTNLDECYKVLTGELGGFVEEASEGAEIDIDSLGAEAAGLLAESVKKGLGLYKILISISQAVPLKSMKAALMEERLKSNGVCIATAPSENTLDLCERSNAEAVFLFAGDIKKDDIEGLIKLDGVELLSIEEVVLEAPVENIAEQEKEILSPSPVVAVVETVTKEVKMKDAVKASPDMIQKPSIELSTIRIDAHKLDNLMNLSGELVITRARFAQLVSLFNQVFNEQKERARIVEEIEFYNEQIQKEFKHLDTGATSKQDVNKIEAMLTAMDSRIEAMLSHSVGTNLLNSIHMLDEVTGILGKISGDIQSGVMSARMVPVEGVFTRFRRVVRDISRELGKEVNMMIDGEDTELDKKIVDSLADPLTHMIRNAVDHGIEKTNEERVAAGKKEVGTVFLKAAHRGNTICIEVGDDGKGMDPDQIAAKAIDKGLITPEEVEPMRDKDKYHLVFLPGFSTAAEVTGLSGRGVGMDVVKNMIASVNGSIDIETEIGKGTRFVLKIPLTLAIIQALLVVIAEETYAIPLESVIEIVKIGRDDIYSVDGVNTIKLREHALSLVELEHVMGIKGIDRQEHDMRRVVVVSDGDSSVGIVVDSLIGEEDIVIKSLTEHFSDVKGIAGASILGDGTIALITDPTAIILAAK